MTVPSEYFARIAGSVNFPLLQSKLVVVVGIGTVGSQIAQELAKCGVSRFLLIDGDRLEEVNRVRHVLSRRYVGMNKAEGLALQLADEIPQSRPQALPRYIDDKLLDPQLDDLLDDADLIVAATDDRAAQRRIGRRALALSIPAIFPTLYGDEGGEVIVQLDPRFPCFFCWDGFRTNEEQLRGVSALNATTLPVIYTAIRLSLGILDPRSEHREMMVGDSRGDPPHQMFEQRGFAALQRAPLTRRPNCPSCAVGPAPHRREAAAAWSQAESMRVPITPSYRPTARQQITSSAAPSHPVARRVDPVYLIASGFAVLLWWFLLTEGPDGFRLIWNPAAWIPVIGWFMYAFMPLA